MDEQQDPEGPIVEDGVVWHGTRAELEAWKEFKRRKAIAFVGHGYSVEWHANGDNWLNIYLPERLCVPEVRARVMVEGKPNESGIDGGRIVALVILHSRSAAVAKAMGVSVEESRLLFSFVKGMVFDDLDDSPAAAELYQLVLNELN